MSTDIAIINYGMGNLRSVENALRKIGASPRIVESPSEVEEAAGLVLPGVGALQDCIEGLNAAGFPDFIRSWVGESRPFLGVCLGLQALFERSEERDVKGMGLFEGKVVRFQSRPGLKIPHMGWNHARLQQDGSPFWNELDEKSDRFYFVHSYYVKPSDPSITLTTTDYDGEFTSAIAKGNTLACQFHPEKSQSKGLQVYRNFLGICG
ncbi:MAG: imidazole glycerol phosphate synthase subunit HisH [Symploca sp. SIO2D2]|nr:imidazole glycerol phosphate synthase subunit HisH [Symploca sp. SIO2D2]